MTLWHRACVLQSMSCEGGSCQSSPWWIFPGLLSIIAICRASPCEFETPEISTMGLRPLSIPQPSVFVLPEHQLCLHVFLEKLHWLLELVVCWHPNWNDKWHHMQSAHKYGASTGSSRLAQTINIAGSGNKWHFTGKHPKSSRPKNSVCHSWLPRTLTTWERRERPSSPKHPRKRCRWGSITRSPAAHNHGV